MNDLSDLVIKPTVLLTGATGFIGTHTVKMLLEDGYNVRCLVRPTSDISRLPKEVELIEGHLLNYHSLQAAVQDCWGVMHVGGVVRVKHIRDFYLVNRDGTSNLVKAARKAGVERFLLCSSQAAGGPSRVDRRRRVEDISTPVTEYGRSKAAGEDALRGDAGEMWWCIVRPPAVYGPWDVAFLTFVKWVQRGFKLRLGSGKMPFSLIHGEDLARAMIKALRSNYKSRATWYATDGQDHTMQDLGEAVERALGKRAIWLTIPLWAAPSIAKLIESLARARGETALLSRQKVIELVQPAWTCDDTPFRRETNYKERYQLIDGMAQTVDWYKKSGWI